MEGHVPPADAPPPPTQPPPPPTGVRRSSGQGVAALLIGIFGILVCCHIVSPVAWSLGQDELKAIRAGRVSDTGTSAKVGMYLGIVGSLLLVLDLVLAVFFGGILATWIHQLLGHVGAHI